MGEQKWKILLKRTGPIWYWLYISQTIFFNLLLFVSNIFFFWQWCKVLSFFGISDGRICWLVVSLHVECQMIWPWETPVAVAAFERLGTCMFPVVTCQLVGSGEPPFTALPRTLVRLLTCKHNTTIFSHSHIFFNHVLRCGKQMEKLPHYYFSGTKRYACSTVFISPDWVEC